MPTLGSDGGFQADNRGGIIDDQGNTIVTSETTFAASPLGIAARTQALYGIPNANFNLTPPDPDSPIVANQNDLPYWSIEDLSDGNITATTVFDGTTQTWGVELNPGTAATDSSLSLSTRSYVLTDDNLALRQKALSVISKSGTAGGTASQWNLQLSAIYYDANDTALSTAVIGTALDTGTWTSFSGTTTPGGSAINSAAQYVDLTYTLTTTAAVTGSVKATIKSLLLTTTSPTTGGGLLVAETFTTSGTWTRPTGVDYLVAVAGYGAGGGGAMGRIVMATADSEPPGASGGGGGAWAIIKDLYVGDVASVSVGIGAGGAGGGTTFNFVGTAQTLGVIAGANGGATTFGSYLTIPGGGGGGTSITINTVGGGGSAGAAATSPIFGLQQLSAGGGAPGRNGGTASAGTSGAMAFGANGLSYTTPSTGGNSGGSPFYSFTFSGAGSVSSTVGTTGVKAGGGSSYSGGGGAGDGIALNIGDTSVYSLHTGTATAGGGGGGRAQWVRTSGTITAGTWTAGSGGAGAFGGGGGGSGGGGVRSVLASRYTVVSNGGKGSDGLITVIYVA